MSGWFANPSASRALRFSSMLRRRSSSYSQRAGFTALNVRVPPSATVGEAAGTAAGSTPPHERTSPVGATGSVSQGKVICEASSGRSNSTGAVGEASSSTTGVAEAEMAWVESEMGSFRRVRNTFDVASAPVRSLPCAPK